MIQYNLLKAFIEVLIILLGIAIGNLLLLPITSHIKYYMEFQIVFVCVVLVLTIYWIFNFNRSLFLKSIWIRSILFIIIIMGLLTFISQFLEFMDIIDSFDISLIGQKLSTISVKDEASILKYVYQSHLLLYSATIISLIVFEFKLLKSILTFITQMR